MIPDFPRLDMKGGTMKELIVLVLRITASGLDVLCELVHFMKTATAFGSFSGGNDYNVVC